MPQRALEQSRNLLWLYQYHTGKTEVPGEWYLWSGISMIASAVANRVFLEHLKKPMAPNLYVFLIGPSGAGKGEAIDAAMKFVKDIPIVNLYAGELTAQYLWRRLGAPHRDGDRLVIDNSKVYFVTEELAMSMGKGEIADALIKHMTGLYAGRDYPLRKGTVTQGPEILVRNACINWIAGTTMNLLNDCIPRAAVEGGFFGRVAPIVGRPDPNVRISSPIYPFDYDEVVDHVRRRIEELTQLEGVFEMTPAAREVWDKWYHERPAETDEALFPSWRREPERVLKIAMILSLADGIDLIISRGHMARAQRLSEKMRRDLPQIVSAASTTQETMGFDLVADIIKRQKRIPHSILLRMVSSRGISATRLKEIIETHTQSKRIRRVPTPRGQIYEWSGGRRMAQTEE